MGLNINDISDIIKKQIRDYDSKQKIHEEGNVVLVGDGIALIDGLDHAMMGELLEFEHNIFGMILNLEEGSVGAVLMGSDHLIKEGSKVRRTKKIVEVGVGDGLLGRVVNSIGEPLDGKGSIKFTKTLPVERIAPGVMTRKSVDEPLETGLVTIDSMIPIGKGQRELIIGDRQTGKTAIAIDTILNQKGKNVKCVYVAIGQKASTLAQVVEKLKNTDSLKYTTIVSATASDPSPLQYLAPYTGITIAEGWMEKGEDVLIIFDDLSKHAVAYRTMALLLRRSPGREAYPGDVFYLHSRLLERACRLNEEYGGGSITALPIVETQAGDISAYIPTNVISITDGQLFLNNDNFNSGIRPAIDVGFSVSRVGSAAQQKFIKQVSGGIKLELAQYRELKAFAQFSSDMDQSTKDILNHGERVIQMLIQKQYRPIHQLYQALLLLSIKKKRIKWIPVNQISEFKNNIIKHFKNNKDAQNLIKKLEKKSAFDNDLENQIDQEIIKVVEETTNKIANYNLEDYGIKSEWNKMVRK